MAKDKSLIMTECYRREGFSLTAGKNILTNGNKPIHFRKPTSAQEKLKKVKINYITLVGCFKAELFAIALVKYNTSLETSLQALQKTERSNPGLYFFSKNQCLPLTFKK